MASKATTAGLNRDDQFSRKQIGKCFDRGGKIRYSPFWLALKFTYPFRRTDVMIELNISAIIQIINFFIVLAVLNAVLYRPIRAVLRKRAQRMDAQLSDIENFTAQAEQKMSSYASALSVAQQKGADIRAELKAEGYQEEATLLTEVNKQAARNLKNAREDASKQVRSSLDTLKAKVDGYAQQVAEKVVGWAM